MRVSLAWLRALTDLPVDAREVAERLTAAGFTVASVERSGDDHALEIEVTTNRPDLLCHLGVAREASGLFGAALRTPEASVPQGVARPDAISIDVEAPDLCPVYTGRVVRGVRVGPSPRWLAAALEAAGQRSVNNVVDVTNYVMLERGQPLHAFDLAKLRGPRIVVRRGRGESLAALDGRTIRVGAEDLAICDAESPAALAGVMGGAGSEVTSATRDVLLESALFAPLAIRATARRHQMRTESGFRFERFVDPEGVLPASDRAARLLVEVCGAVAVGPAVSSGPAPAVRRTEIALRSSRVGRVLGADVADAEVRTLLESLGIEHRGTRGDGLAAWSPPSWRPDLVAEIDLIEEIGRRIGFDRIPARNSLRVRPPAVDPSRKALRRVRDVLVAQGLQECISAPFVAEGTADVALLLDRPALRVQNPMRADECLLRRSLVGPLLATARRNQERGNAAVRLFEQAAVYLRGSAADETTEFGLLGAVISGGYADAKGCVDAVLASLGIDEAIAWERGAPGPLRGDRSATLRAGGEIVGVVGELSASGARAHGLQGAISAFELRADRVATLGRLEVRYVPVSRFPAVERDVAWVVSEDVPWRRVEEIARKSGAPLVRTVRFLSDFRGPQIGAGRRSLAFRMELRAPDRTLTGDEADACVRRVVEALAAGVGGALRV